MGQPETSNIAFNAGILTVSDKGWRGERQDGSGSVIREVLSAMGATNISYDIVPDEREVIADKLMRWVDEGNIDIIFTTGGTGLSPRDVTPEATLDVIDRVAPGFPEAMRSFSFAKTPFAALSRAVAGMRGKCLIINLPGSPKAVRECLESIQCVLPHAVEILRGSGGDCAAVET